MFAYLYWLAELVLAYLGINAVRSRTRSALLKQMDSHPQTLTKSLDHTKNRRTRPPQRYDRHLDPKLRLNDVRNHPTLAEELAAKCGEYLQKTLQHTAVPLTDIDSDTLDFFLRTEGLCTEMKNEYSIQSYYQGYGEKYAMIASELFFRDGWNSTLQWSTKTNQTKAIADGFLRMTSPSSLPPTTFKSTCDVCQLLATHQLQTLAVWEFKNLVAGKEIKDKIVEHRDKFNWNACQGKNRDSSICCDCEAGIKKGRFGPDAQNQWILSKFKVPEEVISSQHENSRKENGEVKQTKAEMVLQQAWAGAVQNDTSFVVINMGNEEAIGFRHRESQTLYLSPLFRIDQPQYAKIHIGLFITALEDAVDRAKQSGDRPNSEPGVTTARLTAAKKERKRHPQEKRIQKEKILLETSKNLVQDKTDIYRLSNEQLNRQLDYFRYAEKYLPMSYSERIPRKYEMKYKAERVLTLMDALRRRKYRNVLMRVKIVIIICILLYLYCTSK